MKLPRQHPVAGYTLAELMVAGGVLVLLGLVFFAVLNSGMILYAKNTAVNSAHQEARDGINRLTRDIHASISIPQLRDTNLNVVSSTPQTATGLAPMAAGVSFQNVCLGPQYIWKDPANNKIMVRGTPDTPEAPAPGMHLVSPLYGVEDDVIKVTATPTQASHHNVFLANGGEDLIANKASLFGTTTNTYSIAYYTNRMMYLVKNGTYLPDSNGPFTITTAAATSSDNERFALSNGEYVPSATGAYTITPTVYTSGAAQRYRYERGEVHLYVQGYASNALYWQDKAVVARYVSNPRPFYIPLVSNSSGSWYESTSSYACYTTDPANGTGNRFTGSIDSRYVGVKLTSRDPSSSNRGYLATATLLNTQIDYRSRIALYQ
ncbi:MAG: hypothetical protein QOG48_455 [Verrucomicrobiota bacterium]|jgi:surface antigen